MPVETLTYAARAERMKISPEAARSLAKRHRLPRSRSNDGKTLVRVDLAEIQHTPLPARSPGGHQAVIAPLKARIEAPDGELLKSTADTMAARGDGAAQRRADGAPNPVLVEAAGRLKPRRTRGGMGRA